MCGRFLIAFLLGLLPANSQDQPTVRTTVPLVVFSASVTGKNGHPVYGLEDKDFEVLDSGIAQQVRVESSMESSAPLALAVVVQTSDFSTSAIGKIRKVGSVISSAVAGENGTATILTCDREIKVSQDFTSDPDLIVSAFRKLPTTEQPEARLLDAVDYAAISLARRKAGERRVILVIGQSRDRGSKAKLNNVAVRLQQNGIIVYGLTYSAVLTAFTTRASDYQPAANGSYLEGIRQIGRLGMANTLNALATATGGAVNAFATKKRLENNLIELGRDIRSRYLITFLPSPETRPGFHSVQIRVPLQPEDKVKVRSGYWAGS